MKIKYVEIALVLSAAGLLAGCNVGATGSASSTIFTGSAYADVPLVNGMLIVTDSSIPSRTFNAPLLPDGSYSVDTASGAAPFLFHVRGHVGSRAVELFSASAANSGKVNISPLTSLVVANAAGQDCAVAACMPAIFTAARLTNAAAKVQTQMVPLLTQFGLAIADTLDSKPGSPARTRKWVFFKHVAAGGFVYSRDGPLEFVKDVATGNWQMAGNPRVTDGAKAGKGANIYVPPSGASSFGRWLPFSIDSSTHSDGATQIVVSSSSSIPPVTLVYTGGDNGTAKITGVAMVEAVTGVSFLPACPRTAGQPGSCLDVAQITGGGIYTVTVNDRTAPIHGQSTNNTQRPGA